jgi:hypothetical protein
MGEVRISEEIAQECDFRVFKTLCKQVDFTDIKESPEFQLGGDDQLPPR